MNGRLRQAARTLARTMTGKSNIANIVNIVNFATKTATATRAPATLAVLSIAAALGAAAALGGCAHAPPPALRPYAAPRVGELLQILTARQAAIRSINARARATSWIGGERLRATVLMLVERAGRLRFEAEVSLQGTVSILTTDHDRFQLLDLRKNQLQQGPACPANVAGLIRIPLAPDEVAAILLGDVKLPASAGLSPLDGGGGGGDAASVSWDPEHGADVLVVKPRGQDGATPAGEIRVLFKRNGATVDVIGASVAGAAGPLWRTSYEELGDGAGGVRLPSLIRFAERTGSFDDGVEIRFKDRTLNAGARPADFVIVPPAGTPVTEVGCSGTPPP
jgi:hypothetical protein